MTGRAGEVPAKPDFSAWPDGATIHAVASKPGGRKLLLDKRDELRAMRDRFAAQYGEYLAEMERVLGDLDLAIEGGVRA